MSHLWKTSPVVPELIRGNRIGSLQTNNEMKDPFMLGKKLKYLRDERKYKQERVAEELGVGTSTYSDYEREVLNVPNEVVLKAVELYKVDLSYFYSRGPVQITMNDHSSNGYVEHQQNEGQVVMDRFFSHIEERDKEFRALFAKTLAVLDKLNGGEKGPQ